MENIKRQVPPHPNSATGDSQPDERMLALCEKAVRHGVQAVAEEIATIYMVEITQVLALQDFRDESPLNDKKFKDYDS